MIQRTDSDFAIQLRAVLDVLPDATFAINLAGQIIAWNRVMAEISNIPADEILGKGDYEYGIPFYGTRRPILLDLALHEDNTIAKNYPYIERDNAGNLTTEVFTPHFAREGGVYVWAKARRLIDADGQIVGAIETVRDITDRIHSEQKLRLLENAIDSSSDGIVVSDLNQPDMPLVYVNDAFERLTGYTRAEILGINCRFLQGEDRDQPGIDELRQALRERRSCQVVLRNYRKDGTLFWNELSVSPIRDEQGQVTHFVGFQHDVTARVAVSSRLQESRARQVALLTALPDTMFRLSQDGQIRDYYLADHVNPFGTAKLTANQPLSTILTASLGRRVMTYIARTLHSGLMQTFSFDLTVDGQTRYLELRMVVSGEDEVVAIVRDISNTRRLQDTQRQAETLVKINQLSEAMSRTISVDELLRTAVRHTQQIFDCVQAQLLRPDFVAQEVRILTMFVGTESLHEQVQPLTEQPWRHVIANQQPQLFDTDDDTEGAIKTVLSMPIIVSGQGIAALNLSFADDIDDLTVNLTQQIANLLGATIESRQLLLQMEDSLKLTQRLYEASRAIDQAGSDLQAGLAAVVEAVPIAVVNRAILMIFERDFQDSITTVEIVANWYSGQGTLPTDVGMRYPWARYQVFPYFTRSEYSYIADMQTDERVDPAARELVKLRQIRGSAVLSLQVGSREIGVILLQSSQVHHFTSDELEPFVPLASQLAALIDRNRLLQRTEVRVQREKQVRLLTDKIRAATSREAILAIALTEVNALTGLKLAPASPISRAEELIELVVQHSDEAMQRGFDLDLLSTLETVVEQVRLALENQRLFAETERALNETQLLYDLSAKLNTAQTYQDIADVLAASPITVDAEALHLFRYEVGESGLPEWDELVAAWRADGKPTPIGARTNLQGFDFLQPIFSDPTQIIIVSDARTDQKITPTLRERLLSYNVLATIALPLVMAERWVGALIVNWYKPRPFTNYEIRRLHALRTQLPVALGNLILLDDARIKAKQLERLAEFEVLLSRASNEKELMKIINQLIDNPNVLINLYYYDYDTSEQPTYTTLVSSWRDDNVQITSPSLYMRRLIADHPILHQSLDNPNTVMFVSDVDTDLDIQMRQQVLAYGFRSFVLLPLYSAGRWQGNLWFGWPEPHKFSDDEYFMFQTLLEPISATVAGRRAFLAAEQTLQENERLYQASSQINEAETLKDMAQAFGQVRLIPAVNRVVLLLFQRDSTGELLGLTVSASWYSGQGRAPTPEGTEIPVHILQATDVLLTLEPIFSNDIVNDSRFSFATQQTFAERKIHALAVLPLWGQNHQHGVIMLQSEHSFEFTPRQTQPYISLARQVAVAIENRNLLVETQAALQEAEAIQARYTVQAWDDYLKRQPKNFYEARQRNTLSRAQPPVEQPLLVRGQPIGVLGFETDRPDYQWSDEERLLIEAVAEQVAQAAENLRLFDETQQKASIEARINEVGDQIQSAQSLEEAMQIAVQEIGKSLNAERTTIKLVNNSGE